MVLSLPVANSPVSSAAGVVFSHTNASSLTHLLSLELVSLLGHLAPYSPEGASATRQIHGRRRANTDCLTTGSGDISIAHCDYGHKNDLPLADFMTIRVSPSGSGCRFQDSQVFGLVTTESEAFTAVDGHECRPVRDTDMVTGNDDDDMIFIDWILETDFRASLGTRCQTTCTSSA